MRNINSIKVAFAGYDAFNKRVHKAITHHSFKDKTSLDVQIYRILVQKNQDVILPFTTDFESIIYDYFDVLILGKLYSTQYHKTVSLARQSLTTGKDIIVTDIKFMEIYGYNVMSVAVSYGLRVEQAYTIDTIVKSLATIVSDRNQKMHGVDAQ